MTVFQILAPTPNARVFELTPLSNGGFVAPIFETAEGSTTRFGALKFALFEINPATGQAEQIGSTFRLNADFPTNFTLSIAALGDGGFVVLVTRIDQTLPPLTTFIRFDEIGVEQSRTDLAANYITSRNFETTGSASDPQIWVRNTTSQQIELLSPETGLPTGPLDTLDTVPHFDLRGLDGGLILTTVRDPDTEMRSFIVDWIDGSRTDPLPIFSSIAEPINTTLKVATAGNQIILASEILDFPADRDEVDVTLKLQMLLPNGGAPVTLLNEVSVNDNNRYAIDLTEIPGIGFAYLRITSSFATKKVTKAEVLVFDFAGELLARRDMAGPVGAALLLDFRVDLIALAGAASDTLDLTVIWQDDPDPLVREHNATLGDIIRLTAAEVGDLTHLGTGLDDYLRGLGGQDSLFGGLGTDVLAAGGGNDSLVGGEGADDLNGDAGDDVLDGGEGRDSLFGGDGNDRLVGGGDVDVFAGGAGDDTISGDDGGDLAVGMDGDDDLSGGAGNDTLSGNLGEDALAGEDGDDALNGDEGNDTLGGDAGNDRLNGGAEDDLVVGGTGNDELDGDLGDDVLDGGDGRDSLFGGDGNDRLSGGAGIDVLAGDAGDDAIFGGAGGDLAVGMEGDDALFGGKGNDTLNGVEGADEVLGEAGNDVLQGDLGEDTLTGGAGADRLLGGEDDDLLSGGTGRDRLSGETGIDLLSGGRGGDLMFGGDGDDVLQGNQDNDTLQGGAGGDVLSGGSGADVFRFALMSDSPVDTPDTVQDFSRRADKIDLSALDARDDRGGNNVFAFIGTGAFSGTSGELRAVSAPGGVLVEGDITGDGDADFQILVQGLARLTGADFLL